jgi:hypothetical protein
MDFGEQMFTKACADHKAAVIIKTAAKPILSNICVE